MLQGLNDIFFLKKVNGNDQSNTQKKKKLRLITNTTTRVSNSGISK